MSSSADSLSRPTADIKSSIARSSNLTIGLLLLFCHDFAHQADLGATKEPLELGSLVGLETVQVFDRQLSEALAQPMQSNSRGAVRNSELVRDLAQRHVAADTNHHYELVTRQLAGGSRRQARDHGARRDFSCFLVAAGANAVRRVTLGNDPLARCVGRAVSELSGGESAMGIAMPIAGPIAQRCDEVAAQVARRDLVLHQMQNDVVQQRRDNSVALIGADAHAASLIPEQRRIEKEKLADRALVSAMNGSDQASRCRVARRGDGFVLFTPRSVVALLHWILPSSLVIASVPSDRCTPVRYISCRRSQARSELSILRTRDVERPGSFTRCLKTSPRRSENPFCSARARTSTTSSLTFARVCSWARSSSRCRNDRLVRTRAAFSISSRLGRLELAVKPRLARARPTAEVSVFSRQATELMSLSPSRSDAQPVAAAKVSSPLR